MFKNYFKTTARSLWKNKGYSFLNIFGLAIGIACAGLIFLWIEDEINFDSTHAKKANLYQVKVNMKFGGSGFTMESTPRPMASSLMKDIPGVVNAGWMSDEDRRLLLNL